MDEQSTAVSTEGAVDTSATESATVEISKSTGDDFADFMRDELTEQSEDDTSTETTDDHEVEEETEANSQDDEQVERQAQKQSGADRRKDQLSTEIRDMVAQKNQLAQELERYQQLAASLKQQKQVQEQSPQTIDDYLNTVNPDTGEYFTPQEAQLNLMAQQLQRLETERQQERHFNEIRTQQTQFANEIDKVLRDFPEFDSESDKFNPELSQRMDAILQGSLIIDPVTQQPIGSHTPIYQLYKTISDSTQLGSRIGAAEQQKATSKMLQSVDVSGGANNSKLNEESDESKFINGFFK